MDIDYIYVVGCGLLRVDERGWIPPRALRGPSTRGFYEGRLGAPPVHPVGGAATTTAATSIATAVVV